MKTVSTRTLSVSSLIVPTALGGALYWLVAGLIDGKIIENELLVRYLVGHPISRITTFLFCVGCVALVGNWLNVRRQSRSLASITLDPNVEIAEKDSEAEDQAFAGALLSQLSVMPTKVRDHYAWQRLQSILHYIERNGSTENVEAELKYESELAQDQQQQRLSFVKILIWATPMLGFLGTVIGISEALGHLNVGPDNNLQTMMTHLQNSLYVAFDTTAQALMFSMVLMFAMFFVERLELGHLQAVEAHSLAQLSACFEFKPGGSTKGDQRVERLGKKMLATTRAAVTEHTRIWKKTIESAEKSWVSSQSQMAERNQNDLTEALRSALKSFADQMLHVAQQAEDSLLSRFGQWQTLMSDTSRAIEGQQTMNKSQCEALGEILRELNASRQHLESELQLRKEWQTSAIQLNSRNQEVEIESKSRWDETFAELGKMQEIQHHRFNQEVRLFQEMSGRLDVARQSFESKHHSEHEKFKESLVEIVGLMQLMKDELIDLHRDRKQQKDQIFRLQIADNTRKAA